MKFKSTIASERGILYLAMIVLIFAICLGAYYQAAPTYLAVAFIGEIILGATAHLSSVIQQSSRSAGS